MNLGELNPVLRYSHISEDFWKNKKKNAKENREVFLHCGKLFSFLALVFQGALQAEYYVTPNTKKHQASFSILDIYANFLLATSMVAFLGAFYFKKKSTNLKAIQERFSQQVQTGEILKQDIQELIALCSGNEKKEFTSKMNFKQLLPALEVMPRLEKYAILNTCSHFDGRKAKFCVEMQFLKKCTNISQKIRELTANQAIIQAAKIDAAFKKEILDALVQLHCPNESNLFNTYCENRKIIPTVKFPNKELSYEDYFIGCMNDSKLTKKELASIWDFCKHVIKLEEFTKKKDFRIQEQNIRQFAYLAEITHVKELLEACQKYCQDHKDFLLLSLPWSLNDIPAFLVPVLLA